MKAQAILLAMGLLAPAAPADETDRYLYLPPAIARSVVFYHSFSQGAEKPEIDRLGVKVARTAGRVVPALTGDGFTPAKGGRAVSLGGLALPLTQIGRAHV